MHEFPLVIPLMIGLVSSLHCLGMCGSLIGALTLGLPAELQQQGRTLFFYLLAAHLGRLFSYALAGAGVAFFGHAILHQWMENDGHRILQGGAALLLVGLGLHLSGWFPALAFLEKMGAPLWRRLEPLAKRWITPRSPVEAFLFGMVWGWFPCALVYAALGWSASACSPVRGAAVMLLFGIGTLPATLGAGMVLDRLWLAVDSARLRMVIAFVLAGMGGITLFWLGHDHTLPFGLQMTMESCP